MGGYKFLGENLAYCAGTACPCTSLLTVRLDICREGLVGTKNKGYDYANDKSKGGVTSHYTQMASSNIYAMGCAAQKCNRSWALRAGRATWWWIGCQYGERGRGYWVGTKPYKQGSGGLVEPPASVFTKNPGLCKDGGAPPPPGVDECAANPCGSGQTCKDPDQSLENDFTCTCVDDTMILATGAAATCTLDECDPNPCGTGQSCKDGNTKYGSQHDYICTCDASPFISQTGSPAQCTLNECDKQPCGQGQSCEDKVATPLSLKDFTCTCVDDTMIFALALPRRAHLTSVTRTRVALDSPARMRTPSTALNTTTSAPVTHLLPFRRLVPGPVCPQ